MLPMVPFPMLPTDSAAERRLYEGFLERLDDAYVVYHSVDWVVAGRKGPDEGETDFAITHPELGLLALEVKGGRIAFDPRSKRWTQTGHSGTHVLDEDPFHQAKDGMHSLVRILEGPAGLGAVAAELRLRRRVPRRPLRARGTPGRAHRDRDRSRRPRPPRHPRPGESSSCFKQRLENDRRALQKKMAESVRLLAQFRERA